MKMGFKTKERVEREGGRVGGRDKASDKQHYRIKFVCWPSLYLEKCLYNPSIINGCSVSRVIGEGQDPICGCTYNMISVDEIFTMR